MPIGTTSLFDVAANRITICGSFVVARYDMAEALGFATEGKVSADVELQPLSAVHQVFNRLEHGYVGGLRGLDFTQC